MFGGASPPISLLPQSLRAPGVGVRLAVLRVLSLKLSHPGPHLLWDNQEKGAQRHGVKQARFILPRPHVPVSASGTSTLGANLQVWE